jgi:hypothetical protein
VARLKRRADDLTGGPGTSNAAKKKRFLGPCILDFFARSPSGKWVFKIFYNGNGVRYNRIVSFLVLKLLELEENLIFQLPFYVLDFRTFCFVHNNLALSFFGGYYFFTSYTFVLSPYLSPVDEPASRDMERRGAGTPSGK